MKARPARQRRNKRLKEPFVKRAKRFTVKSFKAVLFISVAPSLAYLAWWGYRQAVTTKYLAIRTISIAGAQRVSQEEVLELAGIEEGQNLFSFKAGEALDGIRSNPWIREASVKRSLPDGVDIEITERQPIALVRMDGLYIMDSRGEVFKKLSGEDELDLPVITGLTREGLGEDSKGLQQGLLDLIKVLKDRGGFNLDSVSEINVDPVFGLSVYTIDDGIRLEVGTGGYEEKLQAFERIARLRGGVLTGIEAMDLNGGDEVVVRFTTDVIKEGGEGHGQKG